MEVVIITGAIVLYFLMGAAVTGFFSRVIDVAWRADDIAFGYFLWPILLVITLVFLLFKSMKWIYEVTSGMDLK